MSVADYINGFKKAYKTNYKDNNNCPFDKTVDKNGDKESELIKFSKFSSNAISDSYSGAAFFQNKDYDLDEDMYKDIDKNEKIDDETLLPYTIEAVDYES